jgi:hypothetical protein
MLYLKHLIKLAINPSQNYYHNIRNAVNYMLYMLMRS